MKLSIEDLTGNDPEKAALCLRAVILLNGEKVEMCIEADEEEGYIVRNAVDENGQIYLDGEEVATERLEGEVRIIDPEKE